MVERRANAFAAAFLMPRHGISDALRGLEGDTLLRLAQAAREA